MPTGVRFGETSGLGCLCADVSGFAGDAKVRLRLWAVVEAEDCYDGGRRVPKEE